MFSTSQMSDEVASRNTTRDISCSDTRKKIKKFLFIYSLFFRRGGSSMNYSTAGRLSTPKRVGDESTIQDETLDGEELTE